MKIFQNKYLLLAERYISGELEFSGGSDVPLGEGGLELMSGGSNPLTPSKSALV